MEQILEALAKEEGGEEGHAAFAASTLKECAVLYFAVLFCVLLCPNVLCCAVFYCAVMTCVVPCADSEPRVSHQPEGHAGGSAAQ